MSDHETGDELQAGDELRVEIEHLRAPAAPDETLSDGASEPGVLRFPEGFRWGVATASHQYEGGNTQNQWYAWERAGHIKSGDTADVACDWWNSAERDFDLAQELGLNALRLSLEWARIEPRPGVWDEQAIARYRRMLLALRERGIEPMVTLHHFTHPIWFEERGAFLAPDAVERFTRYVTFAVQELGDLCDFWCTINEPNVYAIIGYQLGDFPPGHKGDTFSTVRVLGAMARAHAAAYRAIHRVQPQARVGWAHHFILFDPARSQSRTERFITHVQDAGFNDFFPRAVETGRAVPPLSLLAGDLRSVRGTCDYVGINVYYRNMVAFDPHRAGELFGRRFAPAGAPSGDQGLSTFYGEVYPQGIARVARRVSALGKPIYVTESGVADMNDRLRPWLIATAVRTMYSAIAQGIDLRGYYHWSLVDNFEWADGWTLRFGLAALDLTTQARTLRPSGRLYGAIAKANSLTPALLAECAPDLLPDIFPSAAVS